MALVQDDKRVNLSEPIHITTNEQKTGLEILKEEAQYKNNFKGVDDTIDASCSYDHLIRFCESKYGKIETWDYIEGLFKDADERLQHDLIDCCGWRYDVKTDAQRVRILKNVASNGVLNNNYLIYYAATAIHGDLDHVQLPAEAMKEILSRLNPDQYDYAVYHISNDEKCKDEDFLDMCKDLNSGSLSMYRGEASEDFATQIVAANSINRTYA